MHICGPGLLILYCWHLFRAAVHDSWPPTIFPQHTLHCPFCLSSQQPSENSNKRPQLRVGWEWTAQRQTNLSLLWICWPQHSLFFFSLTLYTDSLSLSLPLFFLSKKHACFSYTSHWLQIRFHLRWWDCEKVYGSSFPTVKTLKNENVKGVIMMT